MKTVRQQLEEWSIEDLAQLRMALANDLMTNKGTDIKEAVQIYNNALPLVAPKKTKLNEEETLAFITDIITVIVINGGK